MRYTFITNGDKKARLKKCYRRFQVLVGVLVVALIAFILVFPSCVHAHGVFVVLAFSVFGIGSALLLRSRLRTDGIDGAELYDYAVRQPMMRVAMVIIAISVIIDFFRVFFEK